MLRSLDRLGAVGTQVIGQQGRHPASLDHLQPLLARLHEAGDKPRPVSTCWSASRSPKGGLRRSSRATTPTRRSGRHQPGEHHPGRPGGGIPPVVPDPGHVLSLVEVPAQRDLQSKACQKVLASVDLVKQPKKQCKKKKYDGNPVSHRRRGAPRRGRPRRAARRPRASLGSTDGLLGRALVDGTRPGAERRPALRRHRMSRGVRSGSWRSSCPAPWASSMAGSYLGLVDRVLGRGITDAGDPPAVRRALRGSG